MEPLANTSLLADFVYDPIKSTRVVEGPSTLYYTRNKKEFKLVVSCVNGKKEGDATLVNEDNTIIANLHFVDDKLNGECVLRNDDYYVIFRGMMKDGHKEGECHEYDSKGNEVFYGFYRNGERIPLLEENATMKGFYNEYAMESRELKSIAEYDEKRASKKGRCFFYKNGKLEKESWMENNVEQYVVREFINNQMIEYFENGVKKYEGNYKMNSLLDIQREGDGIEYSPSGEMIYKGAFVDGEPAVTFTPVKGMKGFMEEKQKGVTLCIGQFNPNGMMKDGTCFEFKKGKVKKECIYANNTLVRVVREFSKRKMTEYDENQKKCYEGEFAGDYVVGFYRNGEGKEFKNDQIVYKGTFLNGDRHGEGVYFRNQIPFYRGSWSDNYPQGNGVLLNAKGEIEYQGEWDRGLLDTGKVLIDFETGRELKRSSRCCNKRGRKKRMKSLLNTYCYHIFSAIYTIVVLIIAYFLVGFLIMNILLYQREGSLSLHSCYSYYKLPFTSRWYLYNLEVSASHCFSPFQYTTLTMNKFEMLASLSIGDNSFPTTNEFVIDHLPVLETLTIGMNAFTRSPNSISALANRRLQITNCESLKVIQIGRFSFSDYDALELTNLPALLELSFGDQEDSSNFYYAATPSFVNLPNLKSITIGMNAFHDSQTVSFGNCTTLDRIILNRGAFYGRNESRDSRSNSLRMTDLNHLLSFVGEGDNFVHLDSLYVEDLPLLWSIAFDTPNSFAELSYAVVLESNQFYQYIFQFDQIQNKYTVTLSGSDYKEVRLYVKNPTERTIWSVSQYNYMDTILLPMEVIYVEMKGRYGSGWASNSYFIVQKGDTVLRRFRLDSGKEGTMVWNNRYVCLFDYRNDDPYTKECAMPEKTLIDSEGYDTKVGFRICYNKSRSMR